MENRIYDERNGLWYAKQGDYYLPELALPSEKEKPIGIWGQRHLQYLKEYKHINVNIKMYIFDHLRMYKFAHSSSCIIYSLKRYDFPVMFMTCA